MRIERDIVRAQLSATQTALTEACDLLDLRYQEDPTSRAREEVRIAELRKLGAKP